MQSIEDKTHPVLTINEEKFNQHFDESHFTPENFDKPLPGGRQ